MELLTIGLVVLFCVLLYTSTRRPAGFPPGSQRLPVLGTVVLGTKQMMSKQVMSNINGNIFGFFIGHLPAVCIESFPLAKELFNKEEWSGRQNNLVTRYLRSDNGKTNKGLVFADGEHWAEQKRFAVKHMKTFGFGKSGHESIVKEEVEEVVQILSKEEGKDILMENQFAVPTINILWSIVASKRFRHHDPETKGLIKLITRVFRSLLFLEYAFPAWGLLAWLVPGLSIRKEALVKIRTMIRSSIEEHRASLDPNNPRDFMDVYISELQKGTNTRFDQESMELTCFDLFKTGADPSASALLWCVLHLTRNQEVQKEAREEVERVCGEERPGLQHVLPYCQAVINEVQRISPVAALAVPHRVTRDQEVEGYQVPAGSLAIVNLWQFMNDPEHWDRPHQFRPERFLEKTEAGGWRLVKHERFVPYGFGKRMCMGESLAKDTLFVFLVSLLQRLSFDAPKAHALPDPENFTDGFALMPKPFYVSIKVIREI